VPGPDQTMRVVSAMGNASARAKALGALAALMLAGCSLTAPFEEKPAALQADPEITGSIPQRRPAADLQPGQNSPFSARLDDEDWRRQKAALATALDPQGNGGQVRWENGESGHKGAFGPIGNAFLVKHEICRVFVTSVAAGEPEQWFQGTACRVSASDWTIRDFKAWKRPG
jgi:surface antigen